MHNVIANMESAIERDYPLPAPIAKLARQADFDLYYGPGANGDDDGYPGWTSACDAIRDALDTLWPGALYYDEDCDCLMTREPEGEYFNADGEPCDSDDETAEYCEPQPYYEIERNDFVRALVGKELAEYVR